MAPSWPPRTLVVAVDRDDDAACLVDRAASLALWVGARMVVVHAVRVDARAHVSPSDGLLEQLEMLDVAAHAQVATLTKRASDVGVYVSSVVLHGEPSRVVHEAVRMERADLVVLGVRATPRSTPAAASREPGEPRACSHRRRGVGELHGALLQRGVAVLALPVGREAR